MEHQDDVQQQLRSLLLAQQLGVLSTNNRGQPYASLVGFAATDDLKTLLFATTRATRKYANLRNNSQVAMLIDNRSHRTSDFHTAIAATATGTAVEVPETEQEQLLALYIKKHPHLIDFVHAPSCAFIRINVSCYYIVRRFQDVVELHITQENV